MKKIIFNILLFALVSLSAHAEDYYFLASEDYFYENPANWFPSYPGTEIAAGDQVVIMSDVYFTGYDLKINGKMKVMLGAKMSSAQGNLIIRKGGELDNEGEILVNQVDNSGTFNNRISANFHVNSYYAHSGAQTSNSLNARFITIYKLVNAGRFDNYSQCVAGRHFENRAVFNQIKNSQLEISGEIVLETGTFNTSDESAVMLGAEAKVALRGDHGLFRE